MFNRRFTVTSEPVTRVETSGFYRGYNRGIAVSVKLIIVLLVLWTVTTPNAADMLLVVQAATIEYFGRWYIGATALFMILCLVLALLPTTGSQRLGMPDTQPEFSRFAWFSMMFGAGIGVGMLTYSTAEPLYHFGNNPDVIMGHAEALTAGNVGPAYKWTLLHYGLTPWACYAVVGLSLAYFSYRRSMPLTIRSPFSAMLGGRSSTIIGALVDTAAILATLIGIAVTIGYGVTQLAFGAHHITHWSWIIQENQPTALALGVAVGIIVLAAMVSALSGLGRGIKWLSNLNMVLSWLLLLIFLVFGATWFAGEVFVQGILDYLAALPAMSSTVWSDTSTQEGLALAQWQSSWTIFYWAWWIAFTPFVGLFLARVSKGRTLREYAVGAIILPSMMCFAWLCIIGGTALDLELSGIAQGTILDADLSAQLFATVDVLFQPPWVFPVACLCVLLLLTYLITSADSAVLVVNTIVSGGVEQEHASQHIVLWSLLLGLIIITLLMAGGLEALRSVMIIGALPFSGVMFFMMLSLLAAMWRDRHGLPSDVIE
ncbi:MAG: BCCT family transporter [Luminiphilus sp.]|nr:BCCT family transporter [Luminiphilus sp.]